MAGRRAQARDSRTFFSKDTPLVTDQVLAAAAEINPELDLAAMEVVYNLMRTQARVMQDLEAYVHRPAGTTWAAFRLMTMLRTYGAMTPQNIARRLHVSASSVSAVVKTLERYEWVTRSRTSSDGRVVTVALTRRGRKVTEELTARNNRREIEWAAGLTPNERKTLARLLRKIIIQQPPPPTSVGKRLIASTRRRKS